MPTRNENFNERETLTVRRENEEVFANTDDEAIDLDAVRKAIKPLLWRVLICPVQPRTLAKGGIALPSSVQDGEEHLNYVGKVVALGPLAGKSAKFENPDYGDWCRDNDARIARGERINDNDPSRYLWSVKEGDCVTYGRYAGQRMEWKGVKLILVNDDEILGIVDSIEGFRIYAA